MPNNHNDIFKVWENWSEIPCWLRYLHMLGYSQSELDELEYIDEQFWIFADREKAWHEDWLRKNMAHNEAEWLKIFPEAKAIIPQKIKAWQSKEKLLVKIARQKRLTNKNSTASDLEKLIVREWIRINELHAIAVARKHIRRLRYATSPERRGSGISRTDIENAKAVPIQHVLLDREYKKSGNRLKTLCPLHNERRPSFTIYLASNSFYCFGCARGGDVITLTRLLNDCGFVKAVKRLIDIFPVKKGRNKHNVN